MENSVQNQIFKNTFLTKENVKGAEIVKILSPTLHFGGTARAILQILLPTREILQILLVQFCQRHARRHS